MFPTNKYLALIIVLIFLFICYYMTSGGSKNIKSKDIKKSSSKSTSKKSGSGKSSISKKSTSKKSTSDENSNDDENSGDEEENINKDAEELYNIAHEPLCSGIQSDEFEELVGDLADTSIFIELKQLYNQCKQKNLDPSKTITIDDYINIMKSENE